MPTLDNRGLEPPEPLLRVLTAAEALGPDEELHVINDRRPMFLYPLLDQRGFVHRTEEHPGGFVELFIRRKR